MGLALAKARAVARRVTAEASGEAASRIVVLGADTEVFLDGRALGKPADSVDAGRMLRALRGRVHEVITGLALVEVGGSWEETASVSTRVRMGEYSEAAVEAYVATGEPFDKAGGYAVQGEGSHLVADVDGCYTNVVGLPVETTRRLLAAWRLGR
jgi:septum formation protein